MTRSEAAGEILQDVPSDSDMPQFAILIALAVISAIVEVYVCLKDHPLFAHAQIKAPNMLQRRRLRRVIARVLSEHQSDLDVDEVLAAVLKLGRKLTLEDLRGLTQEGEGGH